MCYHCATNPSIHHRCCRIAAILSPLSHHGVTFTVTSSQFRHCHCNVAFIIALLRFCRCRCGVAFASVTVSSLLLWCHLRVGRSFVVAVAVLPSLSHCH